MLFFYQEFIFIKIKSKRYFLCFETWLKFWSITLAVILPRVVSWDTESSSEWARLIATVALLLSWFEMMFLLSRFPNWGYYVLMFGKVANKVFKVKLTFSLKDMMLDMYRMTYFVKMVKNMMLLIGALVTRN